MQIVIRQPARVIMTVALPMLIENNNREENEASILVIGVSWLVGWDRGDSNKQTLPAATTVFGHTSLFVGNSFDPSE